jgi:hypothetical protein
MGDDGAYLPANELYSSPICEWRRLATTDVALEIMGRALW